MLGEVLTAIVTPFDADGAHRSRQLPCLCRHLVENGSDGLVVTGTTGEAPTLTDDERFALYEVARRRGRRHAHGGRRHRHLRHGPLGASHRTRARDRGRRLPRRDAVLQQAATARHRRARRGDRGRHRPADRLLRHPEPRRRRRRAGHDLGAGRDPERPSRQAGQALARGRPPRRRVGARSLRGRRRPHPSVPRGGRRRRHLRPHACRRTAGEGDDLALPRRRPRRRPRARSRSCVRRSTSCACRRTRSRSRRR